MAVSGWSERLGRALGVPLAMPLALGTRVRHSRFFHPTGVIMAGYASPAGHGERHALGERLRGPVLVRWSGAWWKRRQWPDVLGCALRFKKHANNWLVSEPGDQDLLLATIKSPWTTLLAALSTDVRDYLSNDYFGVSPFVDPAAGKVALRLRPRPRAAHGDSRTERLKSSLAAGPIELSLEARSVGVARRTDYQPVALITLDRSIDLDQSALVFDPFRTGRELVPTGFVHHLRIATYASAQRARASRRAALEVRVSGVVLEESGLRR